MKWTSTRRTRRTRRRQVVKPQRKWCWTNTSPRSWQLLSHWGCRGRISGDPCGPLLNLGSPTPSFALDWLWLKHLELIWIWIMLESDKLLWLLPVANVNSYLRGRGLLSFPARCSCLSSDILFRMPPKNHPSNTTTCIYGGGTWVSPSGRTDLRTFSWWKLPVEAVATFWCPPGSTRRIPLDSIDSYFFWTLPLNPLLIARQDSFWTCGTGDGLKPPEIDTATRWNPGSSFCVHQIGTSFVMHLLLAKKVKHQLCMAKILGDHFPQHWFLKWLNGVEDLVVPPKIIQILSNTNIYKL